MLVVIHFEKNDSVSVAREFTGPQVINRKLAAAAPGAAQAGQAQRLLAGVAKIIHAKMGGP